MMFFGVGVIFYILGFDGVIFSLDLQASRTKCVFSLFFFSPVRSMMKPV